MYCTSQVRYALCAVASLYFINSIARTYTRPLYTLPSEMNETSQGKTKVRKIESWWHLLALHLRCHVRWISPPKTTTFVRHKCVSTILNLVITKCWDCILFHRGTSHRYIDTRILFTVFKISFKTFPEPTLTNPKYEWLNYGATCDIEAMAEEFMTWIYNSNNIFSGKS